MKPATPCRALIAFGLVTFHVATALYARELYLAPSAEDGGFLATSGEVPEFPTKVFVAYDKEALTATVRGWIRDRNALTIKGAQDDPTRIFQGDVVELFLAPYSGSNVYYQLAANPSGVLYQAKGADSNWRPQARIDCTTTVSADCWSATFTIPFRAFGLGTPERGTRWRANFTRGQTWAPVADFHDVSQFGTLVFGESAPHCSIDELTFRDGICSVKLVNAADTPISGTVAFDGEEGEAPVRIDLPKRGDVFSAKKAMRSSYVPHKNIRTVRLDAVTASGDPVLSVNAIIGGDMLDLLTLDRFYYAATNTEVKYAAPRFASPAIEIVDDSGKAVYSVKDAPPTGVVPITNLPAGRFVFRIADATQQTECVFFTQSDRLFPAVTLSREQRLVLGKDSPLTLSVAEEGKAAVPVYPFIAEGREQMVLIPGCTSYGFVREPVVGYLFTGGTEKQVALARGVINTMQKNPRVLYRMSYEAQMGVLLKAEDGSIALREDGPGFYAMLYRDLKKAYPEQLFSIQIDGQQEQVRMAQNCDVFETAYWSSSYAQSMIPNLDRDMSKTRREAGTKPVIFWLGGSLPNGKCRTAEELRAAVYLSVIRGMAGNVIHLGHGNIPKERTRVWTLINGIEAEIASFYPEFVAARPADDKVAKGPSPLEFACALRQKDGAYILIAVNLSASRQSFSLAMKDGKTVSATFTPYEPRLFRFQADGQ